MNAVALPASRTHQVGLLAVLATATMLFTAFTAAYIVRRTGPDWQPLPLPPILWLNTAVLVASSATLEAARHNRDRRMLGLTALLGGTFAALQLVAWRTLAAAGFYIASNPHSSFFYMLTAVHALHLLGGLVALGYASRRGSGAVDLCATYWHFVGALWIYLLLVLTLL